MRCSPKIRPVVKPRKLTPELQDKTSERTRKRLWDYTCEGAAKRCWDEWYGRAMRSRIEPLKKFARNPREKPAGILAHCRWP